MSANPVVAYFSMEIALDPSVPTYAGGLGILAGDTLRSAADLGIPMVGVTLAHRRGYFHQVLDSQGRQSEEPVRWSIDDFAERLDTRIEIQVEDRPVRVAAWRYRMRGVGDFEVPVFLLDTELPENDAAARQLTDSLYGGDSRHRLCQEAVLGLAGLRMLRALGYDEIARFHLNEGHAALVIVGLVEESAAVDGGRTAAARLEAVRTRCVFTTHTPVPAGQDRFSRDLVARVLGESRCALLEICAGKSEINLTEIALSGSRFINGVAMRHGEISRGMFPSYPIHSITNGVHVRTWATPAIAQLYDRHLPDWSRDALCLRYAISIPLEEIWSAHREAKRALLAAVNRESNAGFDQDVFTLGLARRATAYKRLGLVFRDLERLRAIARAEGPLQIVLAGKAHPRDEDGKQIIQSIHRARDALRGDVAVAYLPNYDMSLARLLCGGSDVWLNTPIPPLEASGTSGMKAAVNGVPSLSILDGWWIEGHVEGMTGWAIRGDDAARGGAGGDEADAEALYRALAGAVMPCFYKQHEQFVRIMRYAIAINAAFFNSERMLWQYLHSAYHVELGVGTPV